MTTHDELVDAERKAKVLLLNRISGAIEGGSRLNTQGLLNLCEAYAYIVEPGAAHGTNVEVKGG